MTQAALARSASTSQPAIAAYESGAKQPALSTLERLVAATGHTLTWSLATGPLAAAVVDMTEAVAEQSLADALRLIADLYVRLEGAAPDEVAAALADDPGSTGDRRWDALVGGVAERLAHHHDLAVPVWTTRPSRFNDGFWFVSPYESLHASALVDTPAELANRGVFLHAASLTGV